MTGPASERSLRDFVLDYALYVPVGVAITVVEELPKLTAKGRQQLEGQVRNARVMGRLAVGEAKNRFGRLAAERGSGQPVGAPPEPTSANRKAVKDTPGTTSTAPKPPPRRTGSAAGRRTGASESPRTTQRTATTAGAGTEPHDAPPPAQPSEGAANGLAIPGYDTLAASHVVQRLSSLRPDELDAIRAYELATRARRTILHRIGQLTEPRRAVGQAPGAGSPTR
ncbi:MAG: hypothetical protein ACRD0Z_17595 [Acidimicrobiales bacterium]